MGGEWHSGQFVGVDVQVAEEGAAECDADSLTHDVAVGAGGGGVGGGDGFDAVGGDVG